MKENCAPRAAARVKVRSAAANGARLAAGVLVLLACACARPSPEPPAEAGTDLPELAAVGGVRDVWPFAFGLDADRETVALALGEPVAIERSSVTDVEEEPKLLVERWSYDGLLFAFLIAGEAEREYLLSVRIDDPRVVLQGGLRLGMRRTEALELLGTPQVEDRSTLVYFYRTSTIELAFLSDRLDSVVLARAMP